MQAHFTNGEDLSRWLSHFDLPLAEKFESLGVRKVSHVLDIFDDNDFLQEVESCLKPLERKRFRNSKFLTPVFKLDSTSVRPIVTPITPTIVPKTALTSSSSNSMPNTSSLPLSHSSQLDRNESSVAIKQEEEEAFTDEKDDSDDIAYPYDNDILCLDDTIDKDNDSSNHTSDIHYEVGNRYCYYDDTYSAWFNFEIVVLTDSNARVTFIDYGDKYDRNIDLKTARIVDTGKRLCTGVEYCYFDAAYAKWYAIEVIRSNPDLHLCEIHYKGWSKQFNKWIDEDLELVEPKGSHLVCTSKKWTMAGQTRAKKGGKKRVKGSHSTRKKAYATRSSKRSTSYDNWTTFF